MTTPVFDGVVYDHNNQFELDNRLFVQFFVEAVQNNYKSEQAGRPIFDEVEMIRIMTPGARDVFVGKVNISYQQRFPKQYAAFKAGKEQPMEGTPLEEVPFLSVAQVAELKAINVKTLEQLANMSDANAQQVMGNFGLRQKAQNFLAVAKENAPVTQMQAELEKRDAEILALKQQMEQLLAGQAQAKTATVAPTK